MIIFTLARWPLRIESSHVYDRRCIRNRRSTLIKIAKSFRIDNDIDCDTNVYVLKQLKDDFLIQKKKKLIKINYICRVF